MDKLGDTKVFVIPKTKATFNSLKKWKLTMKEFARVTMKYQEQYLRRSNSGFGFAVDKMILGLTIAQMRDDRIDNALFCIGVWDNLFNIGRFYNSISYQLQPIHNYS